MQFILNEISIDSQFSDADDFNSRLGELLKTRSRYQYLTQNFKVSSNTFNLKNRKINHELTVREAICRDRNIDRRKLVLIWLTSTGRFHENDRIFEEDNYFEFENIDVTDSGLGEAARRTKLGMSVKTFSFPCGPLNFSRSPLTVNHGLKKYEIRLGNYAVDNIWTISSLQSEVKLAHPQPRSWQSLFASASEDYPCLLFSETIHESSALKSEPFDRTISQSVNNLFYILNKYMEVANEHGQESVYAKQIISTYFSGTRALFSRESTTNKNKFRRQMTFMDPDNSSNLMFADWHGKISHRFFSLHFEWPIPAKQQFIKILYLGPKITKK